MALTRSVLGFIERRDRGIMHRVHRWRAPRWIRVCMLLFTRLGDGWLWYAVGLMLLFFGGSEGLKAVISAGAASLAGILVFRVLKTTSKRRRPCHVEPHCWATILPPDQFSFPSGHTITSFAIAICIAHFYPESLGLLLFIAMSIALSRIILGMHFLSDVLAGALLGVGLAYAALALLA